MPVTEAFPDEVAAWQYVSPLFVPWFDFSKVDVVIVNGDHGGAGTPGCNAPEPGHYIHGCTRLGYERITIFVRGDLPTPWPSAGWIVTHELAHALEAGMGHPDPAHSDHRFWGPTGMLAMVNAHLGLPYDDHLDRL
jgi:hypothetical protein